MPIPMYMYTKFLNALLIAKLAKNSSKLRHLIINNW